MWKHYIIWEFNINLWSSVPWSLHSSGMWHHVTWYIDTNIFEELATGIFRALSTRENGGTKLRGITSQDSEILTVSAARTSCPTYQWFSSMKFLNRVKSEFHYLLTSGECLAIFLVPPEELIFIRIFAHVTEFISFSPHHGYSSLLQDTHLLCCLWVGNTWVLSSDTT